MKYKDSHEQDFHLLKQRQESILQQERISNICESLIFLFLCHKFAAEDDAIQEAMTDGGNDLGIDAVYIDYRPPEPAIHIVQSKQYNSEPKSRNPFKVSGLDKMTKFFDVLKNRDLALDKIANFKLAEKIREIRDLMDQDYFPDFHIWLMSNGAPPIDHEIETTKQRLENDNVKVRDFHLTDFVNLCISKRNLQEVRVFSAREDGILKIDKFGLRGAMGLISAQELYKLTRMRSDPAKIDTSVFDLNVRGFLGFNGEINRDIYKTATSSKNKFFWALNNGITLVATDGKIQTQSDQPKIQTKNLSIVNGAQTCAALFDAAAHYDFDFTIFKELSIPFRLYFTNDPSLIEQISISTNSQNRVNRRDLKANDEKQKDIAKAMKALGVTYVRKRGAVIEGDADKVLDAMRAGQIILSYQLREPDKSKRESDHIFGRSYHKIFNAFDPTKMVRGMVLYNRILDSRERIHDETKVTGQFRIEDRFVTYGSYHILALCGILEEQYPDLTDETLMKIAQQLIVGLHEKKGHPALYKFFRDKDVSDELMGLPIQTDLFENMLPIGK